jgi:sugar phosphate permease
MAAGGGDAAGWSIFFMLVVILAVLSGVVFALVRMARRGAADLDPELQDDFPVTNPSR